MNVDRLNRLLGLFANFGVLAGIIFLAFELNQNTVATRLEAASNFNASFSEIELLIAGNPEFSELLTKGRSGGFGDVSASDQLRLVVFYTTVLRQWQFTHVQYLSNGLNDDIWLANRNFMKQVIHEDVGLYNQWKNSIVQHSPAFNDMIESITGDLQ